MQPNPPPSDPEAHLVHFVPDEVCVRVRASSAAGPRQVYEDVRQALNAALEREIHAPRAIQGVDELRNDVHPRALSARFGNGAAVLHPLAHDGREPWLAMPAGDGSTVWLLYFAVGSEREDLQTSTLEQRQRRAQGIRELVHLLNLHHANVAPALPATGTGWWLDGGAPNWLAIAAQMGCGCPAGLPIAEPRSGRWRFAFEAPLQRELEAGTAEADVVVAILDTYPATSPSDRGNPYLKEVLGAVQVHDAARPNLQGVLPWWHDGLARAHPPNAIADLDIADHGLFIAGIIHDIAPRAQVHLYTVLNEYGVGDELGLLQVLRRLPEELLRNERQRLVVNLSLGATVPIPPRRHWRQWLPRTHSAAVTRNGDMTPIDAESQRLLDASHASLLGAMRWLRERGVLVVAAAGNDALHQQLLEDTPPPPRYPARYQDVFAVAASTAAGAPASYSNRADVPPIGNGITAFGGEIVASRNADAPALTATVAPNTGRAPFIVGVYSAASLPDGRPNSTGWARWAGTSFSAPIIAGVAAQLWSTNSQFSPDQLMVHIRQHAHPMPGAGPKSADPDGPLDAPVLDARQEYQP